MDRITDDTAAHGLRQHSIGQTYPAIIVGHPSGEDLKEVSYYVQFMGHRTTSLSNEAAQKAGEIIARIYRENGYDEALSIFKNAIIYKGAVE